MLLALISFFLNRGNIKYFTENLRFAKHGTQKSVYENGTNFIRNKAKKITVPFSNNLLKPANSSD